MRVPLIALASLLVVATGCPKRWDPGDPPGVSRGSASSGDDDGTEESPPRETVAVVPLDEEHRGELEDGDHVLSVDGTLYDELAFAATEGATIVITMESEDFDPYLHLLSAEGQQLAHMGTPPGEEGRIAEIIMVAPMTGGYRVYANALEPEMRGAYTLRVVVEAPPRAADE